MSFGTFDLHPDLLKGVKELGFTRPTPIQADAIPPAIAGKDILDLVIPAAKARGMRVMPEFMEPLFKYAGHGSAAEVTIPNMA